MAYQDLASRRTWARLAAGVAAYAVVVVIEATLGIDDRATTDAAYVGMALVAAIGWPTRAGDRLGKAMPAVGHILLALPVWVVASGATDVAQIAADTGRALAIVAAWGVIIAAARPVGSYVGGASLLMAFLPVPPRFADAPAWVSPPLAFASGAATTFAHVVVVALVGAAAIGWTRRRAYVITS